MKSELTTETFPDGSTIDTDPETGNRTVYGVMAHTEYFKRLRAEQIQQLTTPAIMAYCRNLDGSRKAELIRKVVTNPITREWLGEYSWEVWCANDPANVVRYISEDKARAAFRDACVHGTNCVNALNTRNASGTAWSKTLVDSKL